MGLNKVYGYRIRMPKFAFLNEHNFLESLGISKQTSYALMKFGRAFHLKFSKNF